MENTKRFLLNKIIHHKENGLSTLGELQAKHVDDIVEMMDEFAQDFAKYMLKNSHLSIMGNKVGLKLTEKEIEEIVTYKFEKYGNGR